MPYLARHAGHAVPNSSLQNHAATNACAQCEHAEIIDMHPGSQPLLSETGGIGIILEDHRRTQPSFDLFFHWVVTPVRKIARFTHHSSLQVDDPRHYNSNSDQSARRAKPIAQIANAIAHLIDDLVTSAGYFSVTADFFQRCAIY